MTTAKFTRRQVLATTSAGAIATMAGWPLTAFGSSFSVKDKLALTGGNPVRTADWPDWPIWDESAEKSIVDMYRSGKWYRAWGNYCQDFEKQYAELIGAKRCLATASGTTALMIALHAAGVDAGDEVLVSPYTFIATYNAVFAAKALPVFVDTDPETFLMDPGKIEERITDRTSAILPVHIYGLPCDMEAINSIAKNNGLKVIEDACQAWSAKYKGKNAGLWGDLGCFSFQNSKHLPAGEGGAVVGNDDHMMDLCTSYHNCGTRFGSIEGPSNYPVRGLNFRMQHVQALILQSQMKRFFSDAATREENARHLDGKLKDIPGIKPYKLVSGAEASAYHLYPFRYIKQEFNNIPRDKFLKAVQAEGIPLSNGYGPQNSDGLIEEALSSKGYKRIYGVKRLKEWREENVLPGNDQLCEESCTLYQSVLLGTRKDMDDIVNAITKVYENREQLLG
ncbi:MAG: DegT/DnrJ/EryC1/StrS family aminotransferase [Cyclobacteriaceae bacterium]|nr:DegT/DnrJ/EryC1/StrS family aminotransferase [Cyclobacteriaceae bacterium]